MGQALFPLGHQSHLNFKNKADETSFCLQLWVLGAQLCIYVGLSCSHAFAQRPGWCGTSRGWLWFRCYSVDCWKVNSPCFGFIPCVTHMPTRVAFCRVLSRSHAHHGRRRARIVCWDQGCNTHPCRPRSIHDQQSWPLQSALHVDVNHRGSPRIPVGRGCISVYALELGACGPAAQSWVGAGTFGANAASLNVTNLPPFASPCCAAVYPPSAVALALRGRGPRT